MATTPNLNLPLIDENTVNDMPRDFNALAEAVDMAVTEAVEGITVPDASLTTKGVVQLSNATNGTRENVAATEKAVGQAFQAGNERKAEVVAALVAIGIQASTSETWTQLIPKIAAVIRATGNATAADILAGKIASNANGPVTGTMPNRSTENNHMPGLESTVWAGDRFFIKPPHGYYNGLTWVTAAVPGLTPENIRSPVNVAGLVGTLEPKLIATGTFRNLENGQAIEVAGLSFNPAMVFIKYTRVGTARNIYHTDILVSKTDPRVRIGLSELTRTIGVSTSVSNDSDSPYSQGMYEYNGVGISNNAFSLICRSSEGWRDITWTAIGI